MNKNEESDNVIMSYLKAFALIGAWLKKNLLMLNNSSTPINDINKIVPNAPRRPDHVSRIEAGLGNDCARDLIDELNDSDVENPPTPGAPLRPAHVSRVNSGLGNGCARALINEFNDASVELPIAPNAPRRPAHVSRVDAGLGNRCARVLTDVYGTQ